MYSFNYVREMYVRECDYVMWIRDRVFMYVMWFLVTMWICMSTCVRTSDLEEQRVKCNTVS